MPYLSDVMKKNYNLKQSYSVIVTSEAGDKLASKANVKFTEGKASGDVININPELTKQTVQGIGTSFTESSAFVLAHLEPKERIKVMENIFSEQGANFSLTRTHIGACDFCVEGRYSYDDVKDDIELKHFNIAPDLDGFEKSKYPNVKDNSYDLLPMIQEALDIKNKQNDQALNIIASAWTAPAWMKDIEDWYQPGSTKNNYQGTGGVLKKEHQETFANYLIKYLEQYEKSGVKINGLTPVNEPLGNSGQWESMHFSAETQNTFIKNHLGPKLKQDQYKDIDLLILDHARDKLEHWADTIYSDPVTAKYVDGAAVHWYESTFKVYEEVFDKVHDKYPDYSIIHTEGCIDDLGKDAPEGVTDPKRYKEENWFNNDDFWWNENATDWGYSVTWEGVHAEDHPIYTPVHRYARNIIVSLNHWLNGWIDWNIVLDKRGGPNHVGNFCGAPIMIDTESGHVYYTPIFYILAQLSKTIRPGDRMVTTELSLSDQLKDSLYSCASINEHKILTIQVLNTQKHDQRVSLQIGAQNAYVKVAANSLQTISIQM